MKKTHSHSIPTKQLQIRILPLPVPAGPYFEEEGAVDLVLLRSEDGGEVLGHGEGGSLQI